MSEVLANAIADMREEEALELVSEMVESGSEPMVILDATREAMGLVGQRYDEGTYFLPELVLAGEMMTEITDILKPELVKLPEVERLGKVLIGTVEGDIHDIGKNIVTFMLDANGFAVSSTCCKTGSVSKERLGVKDSQKVRPGTVEMICNPIVQAELLNRDNVDLVLLLGQCVGLGDCFC